MIGLTILGSTGSIGVSTLDVVSRHPEKYRIIALTANQQIDALYQQCLKFKPEYAVMADQAAASELSKRLAKVNSSIEVLSGVEGLEFVSGLDQVNTVMAAIVGAAGLLPTLRAAETGKRVLLANKEALVVAGNLFMDAVEKGGAELLPIDSEHNAVFQCMPENYRTGLDRVGVTKILLTASGGPFRRMPLEHLAGVTPEQACAHPNWDMGRKISVDSATMMNKGLEVIEACWLFHAEPKIIQVVIHPESVIHSMVAYTDGSVLAQLGNPDMRTPIAHALSWPERIDSGVQELDLFVVGKLQFEEPDFNRFPCLKLAYEAIGVGGTAPAVLNAANEVAVDAFLSNRLAFTQISEVVGATLAAIPGRPYDNLEVLLEVDREARSVAEQYIAQKV